MTRLPDTLAARLTLWYAGIFVFFTAAAFLLFYVLIDVVLDRQLDEDLVDDVVEFRLLLKADGIERVRQEIEREAKSEDQDEVFLRLLDSSGNETYASDMSHWQNIDLDSATLGQIHADDDPVLTTVRMADDDYDTRVVQGLIGPGIILQIGELTEDKEEFMELLMTVFAATFILMTLLAALVGWFMAKQALRGVDEVSRAAVDVANGTLDRRVSVRAHGREIERLVNTFNIMVDRIRGLVSGMREMTDNIAHDLRSPLARIRANSELALTGEKTAEEYRTSAADTIEECDRLLQMINTTLDVAEAEVGAAQIAKDEIDISGVIAEACELFEPVAEDKGIELSLRLVPECHVHGNTQYLQRMFANLLDNALKYTPPRGQVGVEMSANDESVSIKLRDTGPGIEAADVPRIFERFFRCDQSRSQSGCGLGLSLARAVARAHRGDINVSSTPGSGSIFTVVLPVAGVAADPA